MVARRGNGHMYCGLMGAGTRRGGRLLLRALRKGVQNGALRARNGRTDWAWVFGFPNPKATERRARTRAHMSQMHVTVLAKGNASMAVPSPPRAGGTAWCNAKSVLG
eukprot:1524980-Amphidinium_carterae.1